MNRARLVIAVNVTTAKPCQQVSYRSDTTEGPTAGTETVDPLEFLARVLAHLPDKGQVPQRYDGWYANRPRGMRRQRAEQAEHPRPVRSSFPSMKKGRRSSNTVSNAVRFTTAGSDST